MFLEKNQVLHKAWHFLRTYILILPCFDLFLQGSLLILILLETNVLLLLRRSNVAGYMPGAIEDWMKVGSGGIEFLLGPLLAWWGRDKRNYALSTTLALAAFSGFLVLAAPFLEATLPYFELCTGSTSGPVEDATYTARLALLIGCGLCCTLAKASVWAHGLTYLDDHKPENGPYFYGILISIRLSLGLSGQNWLQDSAMSEDWWHAQLSLSSLTLMFAVLFTLFPRQMVTFPEERPASTGLSGQNWLQDSAMSEDWWHAQLSLSSLALMFAVLFTLFPRQMITFPEERPTSTELGRTLGRLMRNKTLILQTLSISLLTAAVLGFVHYDRAYVQARFHVEVFRQDPQTSRALSDIFRSLVIVFFVMIFRVRFSTRRSDGVKATTASRVGGVVAIVVAILLAVMASLSCDVGDVAGVGSQSQQPGCSRECGCDSARYGFSPVCAVDSQTTYFSPCNAGCSEFEDLNGFLIFNNCTCAPRAVRGACSVSDCRLAFSAYQVIYTVMLATAGSSLLMQGMVILRSVPRSDKPLAVGTSFACVAFLAFVCGHLFYLLISFLTCAFPHGASCALHHPTLWISCACSALLALCSAVLSLYTSTQRDQLEPTTEL